MRVKLALAIGLGILSLTFMMAIKITSLGSEQRARFLMDSVQSEVGLAKTNTNLVSKSYADLLTSAASMEETLRRDNSPGVVNNVFIKSPFITIALLEPADISGWNLRWMKNKTGSSNSWTQSDGKKVAKELPLAAIGPESIIWHRHLSKTGHALYTMMVQVRVPASTGSSKINMVALGTLNNQAFSSVVESFKSTTREVMVLDDKGHALAYTSQQYVGAPMTTHPMVEKLLNERKVIEVGEFQDRSGANIIGAYERLDNSNLYAVVAQRLGSYPSLFSAQLISLMGLAVASFLISISLGFILVRPTIAAYEYLQDFAIALGQGLPVRQPAYFAEMPPVLLQSIQKLQEEPPQPHPVFEAQTALQSETPAVDQAPAPISEKATLTENEKVKIYKEVASGLAMALKEPVNVILGQSQLARTKSEDSGSADHYTAIEREARKVRATVENLMKVSGTETLKLHREDLHEIVLAALKEVRPDLEAFGVHVRKDLRPVGQVLVDAGRLKTAIVEILKNSVDSMQESADKEIYLLIKDEGKSLSLLIQDTGSGIPEDVRSKVFTPFFTTKSELDHKGLGLSVAKGIVESCSGKLKLDSTGSEGTRVVLEFPHVQAKGESHDSEAAATSSASHGNSHAIAASKLPTLEDKLPKIKQIELAGLKPLTGSDADTLPTAPTEEEELELNRMIMDESPIEIRDFSANVEEERDKDLDLISSDDSDEEEIDSINPVVEKNEFAVAIRKPKVGSGE